MESIRNTSSTSSSSYSNPKSRRQYHHHQNPHRHRKDIHNVGFADLPYDLLSRIAASFDVPTLRAASTVCRSWREALLPLREAMVLLRWGKRFKYGRDRARGGLLVGKDPERALDSFMKGAEKGSALAMVDAGLMCWEMGRKEEARRLYKEAAELGHPVAQCNLAISYLEAEHPDPVEAIRWFSLAASSGNPRAEYSLGLCYQNGQGVEINLVEAQPSAPVAVHPSCRPPQPPFAPAASLLFQQPLSLPPFSSSSSRQPPSALVVVHSSRRPPSRHLPLLPLSYSSSEERPDFYLFNV